MKKKQLRFHQPRQVEQDRKTRVPRRIVSLQALPSDPETMSTTHLASSRRVPGVKRGAQSPLPCPEFQPLFWGSCPRKTNPSPGRTAERFSRLRGRPVSQLDGSLVPLEAQPQRPDCPYSVPTDRRPCEARPLPHPAARQFGTTDLQGEAGRRPLSLLSGGRLTGSDTCFSSAPASPASSAHRLLAPLPPRPRAQAGCSSSSYFLPVPRPCAAAGSGPAPKSFSPGTHLRRHEVPGRLRK